MSNPLFTILKRTDGKKIVVNINNIMSFEKRVDTYYVRFQNPVGYEQDTFMFITNGKELLSALPSYTCKEVMENEILEGEK